MHNLAAAFNHNGSCQALVHGVHLSIGCAARAVCSWCCWELAVICWAACCCCCPCSVVSDVCTSQCIMLVTAPTCLTWPISDVSTWLCSAPLLGKILIQELPYCCGWCMATVTFMHINEAIGDLFVPRYVCQCVTQCLLTLEYPAQAIKHQL